MKLRPKVNLTTVQTIHEYYMRVFGKEFIKDTTDLFSTITTHKAYIGTKYAYLVTALICTLSSTLASNPEADSNVIQLYV